MMEVGQLRGSGRQDGQRACSVRARRDGAGFASNQGREKV